VRGIVGELTAMARRRTWIALLIGAAVVLAAVLTPIVFDLSPR
jgi:hypothetical protein